MGAFDMLSIAGSSMGMHQTWLDSLANNIANVNTVVSTSQTAFQTQTPIVRALAGGGVEVAGLALSDPNGRLVSDPGNPMADADGYVRAPEDDLATQMTSLVMAQRGFQASVQVTKDAQDTYRSALEIGRR
ncbi:flagellar basal-body rod protein FlgC [Nocardioides sp. Root1257]|uniref:flagellar basal body rod protein FlgC n=1 Tax=unclassified Nocardioides TaxID=2615069 RepID=UPI0006F8F7FC|nr:MULTISPECIES: flagellar basal body rod C-terminal domain-containing protein [unclassified Nocardioides]KQW42579.1 flagellar basal-body rod protein FlgC [Nocardioides sp. Root1257]KRC39837.1 flagellar basal-body rod protein FlgC [Nocardioides sp. Root224]